MKNQKGMNNTHIKIPHALAREMADEARRRGWRVGHYKESCLMRGHASYTSEAAREGGR